MIVPSHLMSVVIMISMTAIELLFSDYLCPSNQSVCIWQVYFAEDVDTDGAGRAKAAQRPTTTFKGTLIHIRLALSQALFEVFFTID